MDKYQIEIRIDKNYKAVECSENTPFMLIDEIKKVVEEYFKEKKK